MTTSISLSHSLRHAICWSAAAACLLAFQTRAPAGPTDVTAVVNEETETLEITRAQGVVNIGEFTSIVLIGDHDEDISVWVNNLLLGSFPRDGISRIEIIGDTTNVSLGTSSTIFGFNGDIDVDAIRCDLTTLDLCGDLVLRGSEAFILARYQFALITGDVTLIGGPGPDSFRPLGSSFSLELTGELTFGGGPGTDTLKLQDALVDGATLVSLGQDNQGQMVVPPPGADRCWVLDTEITGSLLIAGEQGDDDVIVDSSEIGGDLCVDLGNGADGVSITDLTLSNVSLLFLDGGNGNSDELSVSGFTIFPDEYTGFESVPIP